MMWDEDSSSCIIEEAQYIYKTSQPGRETDGEQSSGQMTDNNSKSVLKTDKNIQFTNEWKWQLVKMVIKLPKAYIRGLKDIIRSHTLTLTPENGILDLDFESTHPTLLLAIFEYVKNERDDPQIDAEVTISSKKNCKSRKHECKQCFKCFRGKSELLNHIRTHTGEKPLVCSHPNCNKRYAHCSNLRAHERTHQGIKPYACHYDGCGKTFAHSVSLKEHIWIHAGFQPYTCPYADCNRKFTQVSNFTRHKKLHLQKHL